MYRHEAVQYIQQSGIVAIVRTRTAADLVAIVKAVAEGGVRCINCGNVILLTVPAEGRRA